MEVLGSTGIRISELPYVTVEAVRDRKAEICLKGKYRVILFPKGLANRLKDFAAREGIKEGCIFRTRNGRPLDRSNICHALKRLCAQAGVKESKVYPHSFRHPYVKPTTKNISLQKQKSQTTNDDSLRLLFLSIQLVQDFYNENASQCLAFSLATLSVFSYSELTDSVC